MDLEKISIGSCLSSSEEIKSAIKRGYDNDWNDSVGESFWLLVNDYNQTIQGMQEIIGSIGEVYNSIESLRSSEILSESRATIGEMKKLGEKRWQ